jgi:CubicO group peptidase (beta-lactamase class C family)
VNAGLARLAADDAKWGQLVLRPEALAELSAVATGWIVDGSPADKRTSSGGAI